MPAVVDVAMQRFFSADTLCQKNPHVALDPLGVLGYQPHRISGMLRCPSRHEPRRPPQTDQGSNSRDLRRSRCCDLHGLGMESGWRSRFRERKCSTWRPPTFLILSGPASFTTALLEFLLPQPNSSSDTLQVGSRKRVGLCFGDAHVDKANCSKRQNLRASCRSWITRYAWGTIWSRPELDWRNLDVCWCWR